MSRVKRVWRMGEAPVNLWLMVTNLGELSARFRCPQCGEPGDVTMIPPHPVMQCRCRAPMQVKLELTLEELEEDDDKGE